MTQAEKLAAFIAKARYDDLSPSARLQLKIRILDALACALGALGYPLIAQLRNHVDDLGGEGRCTLMGGGRTAPDRAAFYNSALVRYLDFNDSYLAKGETCHPSDNLGAVLAACDYAHRSGRDLLTALAVAYQVHCRLSDEAPVRAKGFDHTTQGSYAVAAGVAKALGMEETRTANAIAMCGTAFNALRVTRTGALSNWKGLAYANTAFGCTHATLLAMRGITGPLEVFEGNKGFIDSIAGRFEIDWDGQNLERVTETILKKYNAEIHSQSAIEGVLELKQQYGLTGHEVEQVDIEIFDVAFHIIGGGEEGDKRVVRTKEEADHSLPYLVSVALLDGQVMPAQFFPARINRDDVQKLLRKVRISPVERFSRSFPRELPCRVALRLHDTRTLSIEKRGYPGFLTEPAVWDTVAGKFHALSEPHTTQSQREAIIETVRKLDELPAGQLTDLLGAITPAPLDEEGVLLYGP
jgi:2-methylcitrate dehydratase